MPKTIHLGQDDDYPSSMLDRSYIEPAIGELVKFAARAGMSGEDLIRMLDCGITIPQILRILDEKVERTTLAA
jgi:hypothetical protein